MAEMNGDQYNASFSAEDKGYSDTIQSVINQTNTYTASVEKLYDTINKVNGALDKNKGLIDEVNSTNVNAPKYAGGRTLGGRINTGTGSVSGSASSKVEADMADTFKNMSNRFLVGILNPYSRILLSGAQSTVRKINDQYRYVKAARAARAANTTGLVPFGAPQGALPAEMATMAVAGTVAVASIAALAAVITTMGIAGSKGQKQLRDLAQGLLVVNDTISGSGQHAIDNANKTSELSNNWDKLMYNLTTSMEPVFAGLVDIANDVVGGMTDEQRRPSQLEMARSDQLDIGTGGKVIDTATDEEKKELNKLVAEGQYNRINTSDDTKIDIYSKMLSSNGLGLNKADVYKQIADSTQAMQQLGLTNSSSTNMGIKTESMAAQLGKRAGTTSNEDINSIRKQLVNYASGGGEGSLGKYGLRLGDTGFTGWMAKTKNINLATTTLSDGALASNKMEYSMMQIDQLLSGKNGNLQNAVKGWTEYGTAIKGASGQLLELDARSTETMHAIDNVIPDVGDFSLSTDGGVDDFNNFANSGESALEKIQYKAKAIFESLGNNIKNTTGLIGKMGDNFAPFLDPMSLNNISKSRGNGFGDSDRGGGITINSQIGMAQQGALDIGAKANGTGYGGGSTNTTIVMPVQNYFGDEASKQKLVRDLDKRLNELRIK